MRQALWIVFVFCGAALFTVRPVTAQENGAGDQASQIAQLFGEGNHVRGMVTAAAPGSFAIRTEEGEDYKVFYSPNTRIMKDRQPIETKDIHVGDELIAAGQLDTKAKTLGAVFLFDVDAAEVRKAREGLGKTWTAGKVLSIHDLKITIQVIDSRQTQIIGVDENTSFRERGESVTLADIKAGDFVSARGALRGKAFFATVLRVVEPGSLYRIESGDEPSTGGSNTGGRPGPDYVTRPQILSSTSPRP